MSLRLATLWPNLNFWKVELNLVTKVPKHLRIRKPRKCYAKTMSQRLRKPPHYHDEWANKDKMVLEHFFPFQKKPKIVTVNTKIWHWRSHLILKAYFEFSRQNSLSFVGKLVLIIHPQWFEYFETFCNMSKLFKKFFWHHQSFWLWNES